MFVLIMAPLIFIVAYQLYVFNNIIEIAHEDKGSIYIISAITLIIFFIVVLILNVIIVRPIKTVTANIEDISRGKFDVEVRSKERKDEIGNLAKAFDNMRYSLKMVIDEYENILKKLNQSQEKIESLSKIPEINPNILIKLNKNGDILYANPAAREYADAFKADIKKLLPQNYIKLVKEALISDEPIRERVNVTEKIFLYSFKSFNDEEAVFAAGTDITDIKNKN